MPEPIAVSNSASKPASSPSAPSPTLAPSKARRAPRVFIASGIVALVVVAGLGAAVGAYSNWKGGEQIAPGVSIAGLDVGGLTQNEAKARLEKQFGRLFLTVQTDARPFKLSLHELGGAPSIDTTVQKAYTIGRDGNLISNFVRVYGSKTTGTRSMLPVMWSKRKLVAKLNMIDSVYRTPAKNARIRVVNGAVDVVPEEVGRELNIGETAKRIQTRYFVGSRELEAATRAAEPTIKAADLTGRNVKLASYSTRFNVGLRGRTANIYVAAATIEGRVLMPGESFSFNKSTGERTWAKGYRMAHIFERKPGATESEVVDGLAGGVCQVSSTLYNAVRKTNSRFDARKLRIIERSSHSLPVTYVPRGLDATVAWPSKDFRFRNSFDYPVYLRAIVSGSRLTLSVWGYVPDAEAVRLASADADAGA